MRNVNKKIKLAAIAGNILVGSIFLMHSDKASANMFTRPWIALTKGISRVLPSRHGTTGNMGPSVQPTKSVIPSLKPSYDPNKVKLKSFGTYDPDVEAKQRLYPGMGGVDWSDLQEGFRSK